MNKVCVKSFAFGMVAGLLAVLVAWLAVAAGWNAGWVMLAPSPGTSEIARSQRDCEGGTMIWVGHRADLQQQWHISTGKQGIMLELKTKEQHDAVVEKMKAALQKFAREEAK